MTYKAKNTAKSIQDYSIHDPNNYDISRQKQEMHFEKLKKLIATLQSLKK